MNSLRCHIASHETLPAVCERVRPTHLIVVVDYGDTLPALPDIPNRLVLAFNDFEAHEPHGPDVMHAEAVLGFVATLRQPSDLVVACTYGQSRSAAIALAVSVRRADHEREVFLDVERAYNDLKGQIQPNSLLLVCFEKLLSPFEASKLRFSSQHFRKAA